LQHQKKWNNHPGHFHFFISSSNSSWEPKRQTTPSPWSSYQFLIPKASRFDFKSWQGEKIRERKATFLNTTISRTCFPVRPGKTNQSKNVVLVFRISRTAIVQISEPQKSIPLPIQCSDTKALCHGQP
jgi:hypothetical protein